MSGFDKYPNNAAYQKALERVGDLVQARLVECGWKEQVRLACRKILESEDIKTLDDLKDKVTPKARSLVPDSVKRELLHELEVVESKNATIRR